MDLSKTIIFGNSGSGKSWLAERLATRYGGSCIDLDLIHWLPGSNSDARERNDAIGLLLQATAVDRWVVEGIYGSLMKAVHSDATALVWLCLEEAECVTNIRDRGIRRSGTTESLAALVDWAASYRSRRGSSSYVGHATIFDDYEGEKTILRSRSAVTAFAYQYA